MNALVAPPTARELRELRCARGWTQRQAALVFGYSDAGATRIWSRLEAGASVMTSERWTLALLNLGEHPRYTLQQR